MNENVNGNVELCDCNQGYPVVRCEDGLCLCAECHDNLSLTDGTYCLAWVERDIARRKHKYGEAFEPSYKSVPKRGFGERYERRTGSRGWW